MKICFICDLHLPQDETSLQYDVLSWALSDVAAQKPDLIVCAGDVTCDGNAAVYDNFIHAVNKKGIPFVYVPGNSDLRDADSRARLKDYASPCVNVVGETTVFAINDCEGTITDEQFAAMASAEDGDIVFMHHSARVFSPEVRAKLEAWQNAHEGAMLFYGHDHFSRMEGNAVSLQAMDPDKSIGEPPCVTYYDTQTKEICKSHYDAPVPEDLHGYFGISCYETTEQIQFAIDNGLKNIELRPNCLNTDTDSLVASVNKWRAAGGENLSVHLSDCGCFDGVVGVDEKYDRLIEIVKLIKADRVTQHVPRVSVQAIEANPNLLEDIADQVAARLNSLSHKPVIGVENMHMTAKDDLETNRRFGYIPEECLAFMELLAKKCNHKVGINFDIGHARNNAPFSQTYQIGAWFNMIGKHIVGYHMHQVTKKDGAMQNHMPITNVYGYLISYASFFKYWALGRINKAPIVFEMRVENAYETTLETFAQYK